MKKDPRKKLDKRLKGSPLAEQADREMKEQIQAARREYKHWSDFLDALKGYFLEEK